LNNDASSMQLATAFDLILILPMIGSLDGVRASLETD
jgi:hypothetical protein